MNTKRSFQFKVTFNDYVRYIYVEAYTPSQAKALARMQLSSYESDYGKLEMC